MLDLLYLILIVSGLALMVYCAWRLWAGHDKGPRLLQPGSRAFNTQENKPSSQTHRAVPLASDPSEAETAFWTQDISVVLKWAMKHDQEPGTGWNAVLSGALPLQDQINLAQTSKVTAAWRQYFLTSAYIHIGDIRHKVRKSGNRTALANAYAICQRALNSKVPDVAEWAILSMRYLDDELLPASSSDRFSWSPKPSGPA